MLKDYPIRQIVFNTAVVLVLCAPANQSHAQHTVALDRDFAINSLFAKSDDNLNDKRINCAAGEMPGVIERLIKQGYLMPDVTGYCTSVMREALKRGNFGDLYYRMQLDKADKEFERIHAAAMKGETHYINAEGTRKILNCELAFDTGYGWGYNKPDMKVAAKTSDEAIAIIAQDCFGKKRPISTLHALIAGARTAQTHRKVP